MAKTKKTATIFMNIFVLTVLILVFSATVSAQSNIEIRKYSSDYSFFTGAENPVPSICACGSIIDKVIIKNTGTYGSTFNIETNIPQYATLPFSAISLNPGQSVEVNILLSASCSESQKTKNYEVTVTNSFGDKQVIKRNLELNKCQSISVNLYSSYNETLPCVPINYLLELENPATFTETYYVEPIYYKESFDHQKYELVLNSGQKGIVNTTLHFECSIYGDKKIGFNVFSKNNNLQAQVYHDLKILQDYGFNASVPSEINACQYENGVQMIKIENVAQIPNDYKITLKGAPNFVSLSETQKTLEPGQEWDVKINMAPGKKTQGEYNFKIRIETAIGDTFTEQDVKLYVHDCYNIKVSIDMNENPSLCTGSNYIPVSVSNYGFQEQKISLEVQGENTLISPNYLVVESGETEYAQIELVTGNDVEYKEIPILVKARLADKDSWLEWQDTIETKIYSQYSCTLPEVSKNELTAKYEEQKVSFQITNKGFSQAIYELDYEGESFIKLEQDEYTLNPGESAWVNLLLYSDDSEHLSDYYFNIYIKSDTNDQEYIEMFHLKLRDNTIFEEAWYIATENSCNSTSSIILILLLITLVIFIIALATRKIKISKKCKYIIAALAVLVIVVSLIVYGWPKSTYPALDEQKVDDKLYLIWYEGDSYRIDLSEYFVDPDGDALSYSADEVPTNFTISIDESIALLTPDEGWFGTARIRFTATDDFNDDVISPRLDLEVVEIPKMTIGQYHQFYCSYINALLIVLILVILLFFPTKRPGKQPEEGKVLKAKVKKESGYRYYVDGDGDIARTKISSRKKNSKKKK